MWEAFSVLVSKWKDADEEGRIGLIDKWADDKFSSPGWHLTEIVSGYILRDLSDDVRQLFLKHLMHHICDVAPPVSRHCVISMIADRLKHDSDKKFVSALLIELARDKESFLGESAVHCVSQIVSIMLCMGTPESLGIAFEEYHKCERSMGHVNKLIREAVEQYIHAVLSQPSTIKNKVE